MHNLFQLKNKFEYLSESFKSTGSTEKNYVPLIILVVIFLLLIFYYFVYNYLKNKYNFSGFSKTNYNIRRSDFFHLCKNVGLNIEEIRALYKLIVKNNIKFPLSCFTNSRQLDEVLKKGLEIVESNPNYGTDDKTYNSFLLLELKAKIESNTKKNTGIRSTRFISENQKIVIFYRGRGYFYANVQGVTNDFIEIHIMSDKVTKRIFSEGDFIKIYFWREEDAGYTFETNVRMHGSGIREYYINHSNKLVRTQKRKYRRVPVNIIGELYPVSSRDEHNKKVYSVLRDKVVRCNVIDLSAGGLKVRTENFNYHDKIVKLSFNINNIPINVVGKILRSHHLSDDVKELTVQFLKVPLSNKNVINKFVYNYFPGYI